MATVAVVDYGAGNLDSVARAIEHCGGVATRARDASALRGATHVVLPGVGAFHAGISRLRALDMERALRDAVLGEGLPFLGICLGMQMLASRGTEPVDVPGLGWVDGTVRRMVPLEASEKVPHVGWNSVHPCAPSPLFDGIVDGACFYFVHGYRFEARDPADVVATTAHCGRFASAICRRNVFGVQFHPEKSQRAGLRLLRNFLSLPGGPGGW